MKIPRFLKAKPKKLRAATARRPLRIAASANYDEMAEPNMKLSRALLIVLVLHVVAVSGIIAFNAIKTRQTPRPAAATAAMDARTSTASANKSDVAPAHSGAAQKDAMRHDETRPARAAAKPNAKEDKKGDRSKSAGSTNADSGKVYVVAKGDNPVTIAKKLKVSYDELLALNHIDDPHKLQVGRKLLIPNKTVKAKKNDE